MSEQAKCRSCGAAIIWAKTEAGKSAPFDAEPAPDGNVILERTGTAFVVPEEERSKFSNLHKNHFATCPNAKTHRKKEVQ